MPVQRRLLLLIALLASLLMAPAAASAKVSISLNAGAISITGDDEDNVIFETGFDQATPWFTTPAPGVLAAGSGCNQLSPTGVECPGTKAPTRASVDLGAGDDLFLWSGTSVALTINGGPGDDEISGGQAADTLIGGSGDDILVGFGGNDRIDGNDGLDIIDGSSGDDRIDGGAGIDRLNGDGEGDAETAAKPFGDDTIVSRDGFADEVECEGGTDTAIADRLDKVSATCENISYTEASHSGSGAGPSGSGNGSTAPQVNAPQVTEANSTLTLTVKRGKLPKLGSFRRGLPIRLSMTASNACRANIVMSVSAGEARRLKFRGGKTIGRASGSVAANKRKSITLRGSSLFRARLKKQKSTRINLRVTCKPPAGKSVTARLIIRLKH